MSKKSSFDYLSTSDKIKLAGVFLCIAGIPFVFGMEFGKSLDNAGFENEHLSDITCDFIYIDNGEFNRLDNITVSAHDNEFYDYVFDGDKKLYIYIYNPNERVEADTQKTIRGVISKKYETPREIYTDFIVSNIIINDDNTIIFDPNNISPDNFQEYKNNILINNDTNPQRVRK